MTVTAEPQLADTFDLPAVVEPTGLLPFLPRSAVGSSVLVLPRAARYAPETCSSSLIRTSYCPNSSLPRPRSKGTRSNSTA
jgi:hypothetical protein